MVIQVKKIVCTCSQPDHEYDRSYCTSVSNLLKENREEIVLNIARHLATQDDEDPKREFKLFIMYYDHSIQDIIRFLTRHSMKVSIKYLFDNDVTVYLDDCDLNFSQYFNYCTQISCIRDTTILEYLKELGQPMTS